MSKKKDNSFYVRATCRPTKDHHWVAKSKKPDIETEEETEIQGAIDSFEAQLKKMLFEEHKISSDVVLVEDLYKAGDGKVIKEGDKTITLDVEYENFKVMLVYRIGSPVNKTLSEYSSGEAEA